MDADEEPAPPQPLRAGARPPDDRLLMVVGGICWAILAAVALALVAQALGFI